MSKGMVYLIGAGPGDPDLITLKGVACIRKADVIVYDHIVDPELLRYAREGAECIDAGKTKGLHTMEQDEINALLVTKANEGKAVARLKGGDPFVFGRGAEEALYVHARGIQCEVVPGVSSLTGVATANNIPLTHRGVSASVSLMTGRKEGGVNLDIVYADTMVFVMSCEHLPEIIERMLADGISPAMPAVVIERGTWRAQRRVQASLADIGRIVKKEKIVSPAVFIVGKSVEVIGKGVANES